MAKKFVAPFSGQQDEPANPPSPDKAQLAEPNLVARPRRNLRLTIAGVLFCALGALLAAWIFVSTSDTREVLTATRDIKRGETLSATDISTTNLGAAAGVPVMEKSKAGELVGRYAMTDIPAGSLLGPKSIGQAEVDPESSMIGLRLAAGRLPAKQIPPGSTVKLVEITESGPGQEFAAMMVGQSDLLDGQGKLVDVTVNEMTASTVAALAASDKLVLVRQADAG